ncbi:MAG: serine hydrolase, partial [Balneolaceae bacterium]|nr:serine hydrolase [Balneolaceae bacterium]
MRILKFIGAFVGTFLVVFLIVFGFNLQSLEILFRNSESLQEGSQWVEKTTSLKGLTEYVGANAGHVSILSRSIEKPDSVLSYQPQTRRSMGRLANLFLLIEYARQVEKGEIDPGQLIPVDSVRRYQLPYIDQSGHEDAIDYLQNNGFVTDGLVPLDKLVDVTTRYNDLASADFLYFKLGSENIRALVQQKLGLQHTDTPLPFSGLYQRVNPKLAGTTFDNLQNDLRRLDRRIFEDQALVLSRKFAQQGVYRNRVLRTFEENSGMGIPFTKLRDALEF